MHVFLTGGTGLIGTRVVAELLAHDHTVLALARSERSERALLDAGTQVLRGSLGDLSVLRHGAEQADGVVQLAFGNDFSSAAAVAEETAALRTLGTALVETQRPLVVASGTPWIAGRVSTEADPTPTDGAVGGRGHAVDAALALAQQDVRTSAIRLPRTVHDHGRGGFAGLLTQSARNTRVSAYPGDGGQRWPAVHARDAATLFRLALENAAAGTVWHAVAEEGVAVRDIATVIGHRLGLPVESRSEDHFGPLGPIFAIDQPASSAHTRESLGWEPTCLGLLDDLGHLAG